jgi:hypothetical protein
MDALKTLPSGFDLLDKLRPAQRFSSWVLAHLPPTFAPRPLPDQTTVPQETTHAEWHPFLAGQERQRKVSKKSLLLMRVDVTEPVPAVLPSKAEVRRVVHHQTKLRFSCSPQRREHVWLQDLVRFHAIVAQEPIDPLKLRVVGHHLGKPSRRSISCAPSYAL